MLRLFLLALALVLAPLSTAVAGIAVNGIRTWAGEDYTRVVFDLSGEAAHSLFTLENPSRVVIDLSGARMDPVLASRAEMRGVVGRIRSGAHGGDLRVGD